VLRDAEPRPEPDAEARRRLIRRSIWVMVPATLVVVAVAYRLIPPIAGLDEPSERLVFATRWLLVAALPYFAVCLTILRLRYVDGAHDPTRGEESRRLTLHCRVMQNTLEQLVWFAICLLAAAPLLAPEEARLVPVVAIVFLAARLVYWRGYFLAGTLGRAPGVQMTFTLNIALLVLALVRLVKAG
jgi:uncharacterized membrane protein YecN with MAPEG domain